jgi:circadian clock protein KaiC
MNETDGLPEAFVATGIEGLDHVLSGGFTPNQLYLVEGAPGSGKTTLSMQYLLEGAKRGEQGLYVTLSETKKELEAGARSHGWSLDQVIVCELAASEENLKPDAEYTMFHPSEVELGETTKAVLAEVQKSKAKRVVFDSLSELRLLAQSPLRYRRQILAIKQFFIGRKCTVLLLDDRTSEGSDLQLQSIAHGVITLEQLAPEYGADRRRLRIVKMRGRQIRGGYHDFTIRRGGLQVFPRLIAAEHRRSFSSDKVKSGLPALDQLLGGGLDPGTSSLFMGPAGAGKSSVAMQYAVAAAARGDRAVLFMFDESLHTMRLRAASLGIDIEKAIGSGHIRTHQIDPAEVPPGEFAHLVRQAVDRDGAKLVVIDSLNGYLNAMPEERFLMTQLHELLTYLGHQGVVTILIVAQHGLIGGEMQTPVDTSYLADVVLVFRYFETAGTIRQAISVMKKRSGQHERSVRELTLSTTGIHVGDPLKDFQGILAGVPNPHWQRQS